MGKCKLVIILLLTIAVLICGAFVPALIARLLDGQTVGKSTSVTIASVELNIRRELSPTEKLAMVSKIDNLLPVKESKARMTGEEVLDAVTRELTPYMDAQLLYFRNEHVQMQPYLVQIPACPELQRVIWQVTVSGEDADFTFTDLLLDDETGKILRLSFTAEDPPQNYVTDVVLNAFAEIFFSGMGIEDPWRFLVKDLETAYTGDHTIAVRFLPEDPQYGQIPVDLYIYDHGFYVEFPSDR